MGFEEGSPFLNKIKNKPYSVILLDEIEKAHSDIFNVFLQMLDEGMLTDGHGRKINFKNCININCINSNWNLCISPVTSTRQCQSRDRPPKLIYQRSI